MVDQLESSRECGRPVLVTVCQQRRDKHLAVRGFLKFLRARFLTTERAGAELLYGPCEQKAPVWISDGAETAGDGLCDPHKCPFLGILWVEAEPLGCMHTP